jgi:hypothetical protein
MIVTMSRMIMGGPGRILASFEACSIESKVVQSACTIALML